MKNKLLFLAVIFLVIAVQFIAAESSNRKSKRKKLFICINIIFSFVVFL